jgi:hypothetical protein
MRWSEPASVPEPAAVVWRRLDLPGHDSALLRAVREGWRIDGVAVFSHEARPCCLRYSVHADDRWRTTSARVTGWLGTQQIALHLLADAERRWSLDGTPVPEVTGCLDVDLAFTPATNLLPIRRLDLPIGASQPAAAAWLTFPELSLRRLDQAYGRRGELEYAYESLGGSFRTTLQVSPAGFVTDYPGLWAILDEPPEPTAAPSPPSLGPAVPILRVGDLDASVSYYLDRLGFRLEWRSDPLASVRRDRTSIMLSAGDQGRPGTWLWIAAGDVDQLYAELEARGARLRHPPTNYPWGSRECQVMDPDGHVLRFGAESQPGEPLGDWLDGQGRRWTPQPDGSWRAAE